MERDEVAAEAARLGVPILVGITEDAPGEDAFLNAQVVVMPDGTITDRSQTIGSRPNRPAAAAAVAAALIVAAVGWYTRPSNDLAAGDCFRYSGSTQVRWIACDEPHDGEIFLMLNHPAVDTAPFPGPYTLEKWGKTRCDPEFTSYVGRPVRSDDGLTYVVWTPYAQDWTQGDREILCAVVSESGERLSERAKGS